MCGRYIFYDEQNAYLKEMLENAKAKMSEKTFSEISLFEVYPGQKAFTAVFDQTKKMVRIKVMQWGFSLNNKQVINARSESCFHSSFFQDAVPCVLPASAYYEWTRTHQKYEFRTEQETIFLAGLAHHENEQWHFVILTEQATGDQATIHFRQPVVFNYEDAKKWCSLQAPTSISLPSIQKRLMSKCSE